MTRRLVVWILLVSVSAGVALHTSLRVRTQEERLQEIHRAIADEQERIRVLTAEWHMLKSPARLEVLAGRHLDSLKRIKPEQMAGLDKLPTPETLALAEAAAEKVAPPERPAMNRGTAAPVASVAPVSRPSGQAVQKAEKQAEEDLATLIARVTPVTPSRVQEVQEVASTPSGRGTALPKAALGDATVWGSPVQETITPPRPQVGERGKAGSIGDLIRREGRADAGAAVILASTGPVR